MPDVRKGDRGWFNNPGTAQQVVLQAVSPPQKNGKSVLAGRLCATRRGLKSPARMQLCQGTHCCARCSVLPSQKALFQKYKLVGV
eukprot:388985-Pelagomonas_calceolata.AAC.9